MAVELERNPHDIFVRYVFRRPQAVAIILRRVLPAELLACLDLSTLRHLPSIYSSPLLARRESDLLFVVDLVADGRRTPVYVAIEHQSTLDVLLPWRALVYVGGIWGQHVGERSPRPRMLPLILPVALVQSRARNTPTSLSQILDVPPSLRSVVGRPVELEMLIDDLSGSVLDDPAASMPFRALVELARLFLYAHGNPKAISDPRLAKVPELFDIVLEHFGPDDVRALWNYMILAFDDDSPFRTLVLRSVGPLAKEEYMTTAERLLAEGRARGMLNALLDLLEYRSLTISEPLRERMHQTTDESILQCWIRRAATAMSVEEVFGS